jgi:hypothetical protein
MLAISKSLFLYLFELLTPVFAAALFGTEVSLLILIVFVHPGNYSN